MIRKLSLTAAAAALAAAQPAAADIVADWWSFAGDITNPYQPSAAPRTPDQERAATRAALAMFEAVNAVDRRYQSHLGFPAADPSASQDAAAATAAYRVLLHAYPSQRSALDDSYAITMAEVRDEAAREAGRLVGEAAAAAAMAVGGIDPAIEQRPYRPRTRPGEWVPTNLPSLEAQMYAYRPWVIPSADALRPPAAGADQRHLGARL